MQFSRREFAGGALTLALASGGAPAFAQAPPELAPALAAIRAYGEAHRSYIGLPGMTLGVTTPDGFSTVLNFGYANADARTPISSDTLFQIGSITKVMVAAVLHQFVAQGRFRLTDRLSALLPSIPLPSGNTIEVQHVLDHVAGLPGDSPMFPAGGLWTAYSPGAHWHYSNTGFEILGKLAEHFGGKPLDRLLEEHIFAPLAMNRSRGAIIGEGRVRYAQGYEAADQIIPFARGVPLAPAAWVDVTTGAGCVASTAEDMTRFLRALANAVQGRGAFGLPPQLARTFTTHSVPSDTPGMTYGNGIMHVGHAGRAYLHHTGGMVSFSSSYHVDVTSGVGAFASTNISAFAEYRPRQLTQFAVDALTNAIARRPLPSPPRLAPALAHPSAYVGSYSGPSGSFEISAGTPLTISAGGRSAALEPTDNDLFSTAHPAFREFSLLFARRGASVVGASWGPNSYLREGQNVAIPRSDPQLARLAGRYVNDSPWFGMAHVVERGGRLWIGTETPMQPIGRNLWRIGDESWSPERGSFADFIDGRPQTFIYSGEKFLRHDI